MSLRVQLSAAASRDADRLHRFIAADDPKAAAGVLQRINQAILLIAAKPLIGRPSQEEDVREWSVGGLPYMIPYRVVGETLQVIRIFHTSQKRPER